MVSGDERAARLGLAALFELQTRPAADGDELMLHRILDLLRRNPDEQVDLSTLQAQTGSTEG